MASTSAEIPATAGGTADQPVGRTRQRATATWAGGGVDKATPRAARFSRGIVDATPRAAQPSRGLAETTPRTVRPTHGYTERVWTGIRRVAG